MIIAFEGMDGSGKSVMAEMLVKFINVTKGEDRAVLFRDPGSTEVGEAIRRVIMDYPTHQYTELFLFNAARTEMVETCIKPALEKKQIVVLDRFIDSTRAYQGAAGVNPYDLEAMIDVSIGNIRPDYVFFLDVEPSVGMARKVGQDEVQKFEMKDAEYKRLVREIYLSHVRSNENYLYIDTTGKTLEQVFWLIHNKIDIRHPYMI